MTEFVQYCVTLATTIWTWLSEAMPDAFEERYIAYVFCLLFVLLAVGFCFIMVSKAFAFVFSLFRRRG